MSAYFTGFILALPMTFPLAVVLAFKHAFSLSAVE